MIKLSMSEIFKIIFFLLVFQTYSFANSLLFDQNDKLFLKTTNSGFTFHKNFMGQNKHNFGYIKAIQNQEVETIIKNLNLETVIVLVMKIGMTAIMIDKGLSFLQSLVNQYLENNVMVTV